MISNLLINAIQHGGGKQVRVTAKGDDDSVFLEVHNLGAPIPEEMLRVIFDPLFQGNDLAQTREGLGLGLFIVDQIVSAHGGTITVSSSQEEGTIFWCAFRAGYRHERECGRSRPDPPPAMALTKHDANGIRFSRHPGH
jgi:signal transduction histidine kinase